MPPANAAARSRLVPEKAAKLSSELAHCRFHPLPHVVSTRAGDTTVLMDMKRGTYHTLNEVGGRIWELVGGGGVPKIVERLLDEYDASRQQIEADVAATLRQLLADQLISPGATPPSPPVECIRRSSVQAIVSTSELRVPSVLRAGLMITWIKVLLRLRGFAGAIEWIRRRVDSVPG